MRIEDYRLFVELLKEKNRILERQLELSKAEPGRLKALLVMFLSAYKLN